MSLCEESASLLPPRLEHIEKIADLLVPLGRMAHLRPSIDGVVIAAADPLAPDIPALDQIGDDALSGALGDPDPFGDVAHAHAAVARDAEEDLRVVGDEAPGLGVATN